jgi:hypothetical protein
MNVDTYIYCGLEVYQICKQSVPDAFHLISNMTFPHVGQSLLFFNMFVLLHIGQKLHT